MNKFSERLKLLRNEQGYTQKELAKELNVCQSAISSWENGLHEPSIIKFVEIADYFQVTTDYLSGHFDKRTR